MQIPRPHWGLLGEGTFWGHWEGKKKGKKNRDKGYHGPVVHAIRLSQDERCLWIKLIRQSITIFEKGFWHSVLALNFLHFQLKISFVNIFNEKDRIEINFYSVTALNGFRTIGPGEKKIRDTRYEAAHQGYKVMKSRRSSKISPKSNGYGMQRPPPKDGGGSRPLPLQCRLVIWDERLLPSGNFALRCRGMVT